MDIERSDEAFMVRSTTPKFFDGALQVNNDGETVTFAIDEANGHLNTGSDQYRRVETK